MSYFRSAKMVLFDLYMKRDHAFCCIAELGEVGLVQFNEVNEHEPIASRVYALQIVRCLEMEKKLKTIMNDVKEMKVPLKIPTQKMLVPTLSEVDRLEQEIEKPYIHLSIMKINSEDLQMEIQKLKEMKAVINLAHSMTHTAEERLKYVNIITGAIPMKNLAVFERMLFRISFGNIIFKHKPIEEAVILVHRTYKIYKAAFILFYYANSLTKPIDKICDAFRAEIHHCPTKFYERITLIEYLKKHMEFTENILKANEICRAELLHSTAKKVKTWEEKLHRAKSVYSAVNMCSFDSKGKSVVGEVWIPRIAVVEVEAALRRGAEMCGTVVYPILIKKKVKNVLPPTYNYTNKVTEAFQNLVDAYAVGSYMELNPVPFMIITFPFLFSIMFGDIGHGFILFLFALYLIVKEKQFLREYKEDAEIWNIFFGGRYIILLMGLFSMYAGVLYNDLFSKPINLFGSSWTIGNLTESDALSVHVHHLDPTAGTFSESPYIIGIDPIWLLAKNKIIVGNSVKMKLSIILGLCHMLFGLSLSTTNAFLSKKYHVFFLEVLPQILLLLSFIGYLVFLIIFKWFYYRASTQNHAQSAVCAPFILIEFINMALFRTKESERGCPSEMYSGQMLTQNILMGVFIICIPWILCGNPIFLIYRARIRRQDIEVNEILIHQVIETIEFVLGTISHTASYLRLWALSLAHSQLSEVLWRNIIRSSLNQKNVYQGGFFLFIVFYLWAFFTVVILVLMEALSAFLHTLRLHWVEFQSKFYEGEGLKFRPFNFTSKGVFDKSNYDALLENEDIKEQIRKVRSTSYSRS